MRLTILGSGDAFGAGGRHNTCLLLDCGGPSMMIDCGASAPRAWAAAGLDRNRVGSIVLTHFHGDHIGGLPFFLLDARFISRRETPLEIAGPRGVRERVERVCDALFPGFAEYALPFPVHYRELEPAAPASIGGVRIETFPVRHDENAGPCQGYRFAADGKLFAFSGDTAWTDTLVPLASEADLLLCECYTATTEVRNHLAWTVLERQLPKLTAARILLTHMSEEMLRHPGDLPVGRAHDGLAVTL